MAISQEMLEALAIRYKESLEANPYRVLREKTGLSQVELSKICGFTPQVIYRHEAGLMGSPSPRLGTTILSLLSEESISSRELEMWFDNWKSAMREIVADCIVRSPSPMFGPLIDVNFLRDIHPFYTFMYNFNASVGPMLGILDEPRSVQLFNRLLCIHPRSVQQYLESTSAGMSEILGSAMNEAGINDGMMVILQGEIRKYLGRTGG